jgi:DNA polymerase I-like protein with 3'-5' exonuclease and polymerase domains
MIKHTFRNFVMPLANIVLEMGLKGVALDKDRLREFRVGFDKEWEELAREYRRRVIPYFGIRIKWKELAHQYMDLKRAEQKKEARGVRKLMTAMKKKIKSQLNPNSAAQQKILFYTILGLPKQINRKTKSETLDEEAIQKLLKLKKVRENPHARDLLENILLIRGIAKKISTYCLEEDDETGRGRQTQDDLLPSGNDDGPVKLDPDSLEDRLEQSE